MPKPDIRPQPPAEVQPLARMFVLYMDGSPLLATEYGDVEAADVLREFEKGVRCPKGHTLEFRDVVAVPTADLERIAVLQKLRGNLFAFEQIALANRMQNAGLVAPPRNFRPGPGN